MCTFVADQRNMAFVQPHAVVGETPARRLVVTTESAMVAGSPRERLVDQGVVAVIDQQVGAVREHAAREPGEYNLALLA